MTRPKNADCSAHRREGVSSAHLIHALAAPLKVSPPPSYKAIVSGWSRKDKMVTTVTMVSQQNLLREASACLSRASSPTPSHTTPRLPLSHSRTQKRPQKQLLPLHWEEPLKWRCTWAVPNSVRAAQIKLGTFLYWFLSACLYSQLSLNPDLHMNDTSSHWNNAAVLVVSKRQYLVLRICRNIGFPADCVVASICDLLVLRQRVVCPSDSYGVVAQDGSLNSHRWHHGRRIWHWSVWSINNKQINLGSV